MPTSRCLSYAFLATLASSHPLLAANITDTWNPALATGNWSTAANWSAALPGTDPASLYDLQIQSATTSQSILYDLPTSPLNLNSLTIDATGNHTTTFSLTDNNTLTIQNTETIGLNGNATFIQTAGTNSVGVLTLAKNAGANATYTLGDTNGSNPTLISKTAELIGGSGNATFTQYSGNNIAINLFVGFSASATYYLAGGNLTLAGGLFLGDYVSPVSANFLQTGGNLTVNAGFTYPEFVGYNTTGNFTQLAGNHTVASDLNVGFNYTTSTPSTSLPSTYILGDTTGDSPTLSIAGNLTIGNNANGSFTQYSGNLTTAGLILATTNTSKAAFVLNGGNVTITAQPLYIYPNQNISNTTFIQNGGILTLNGGALYVGYTYSSNPIAYTQNGGALVVNATDANNVSEYIGYLAAINFMQTNGTNTAAHDMIIGNYNRFSNYILGNQSGADPTLNVIGNEKILNANFTQYSGNHTVGNLYIGNSPSGFQFSNYSLYGGTLANSGTAGAQYVGYNSPGTFTQYGGVNAPANLYIAYSDSSYTDGEYDLGNSPNLTPSLIVSGTEFIGFNNYSTTGNDAFIQYSGNNSAGTLIIGGGYSGHGNYSLMSGNLTITSGPLYVAYAQSAGNGDNFTQSGGNLFANGSDANNVSEYIGYANFEPATFIQTSGNHTVLHNLLIGQNSYRASYTLGNQSGANPTLSVIGTEKIILGTFTQYSGNHTVGNLYMGVPSNQSATFTLYSGNLTTLTAAGAEYIGYNGRATFNHYGGTNSPANLYVGYSDSSSSAAEYDLGNSSGLTPSLIVAGTEYIGFSNFPPSPAGTFIHYSGNNTAGTLIIGEGFYGFGNYSLMTGSLTITTGPLYLAHAGYTSPSNFTQLGGNISANGTDTYSVSEYIGFANNATFTQSDGNNTAAHDLVVGPASGTYILGNTTGANPTLTVLGSERIGASNSNAFIQYSGNNLTTNLYLGNSNPGNYTLNGGNLSISANLYLAYRYNNFRNLFSQNAGNITAASEYIGYNGSGNYNHINGNNTLSANLYISFADSLPTAIGAYTLGNTSGASPSLTITGTEYIGYATSYQISGTFTQYSGNNTTGSLTLGGGNFGASGNYSLLGGNLTLTSGPLSIGAAGSAGTSTFLQSGGNIFANAIDLSGFSESIGINSFASFIQSGGNNSLTGNFALALVISSRATYTINSSAATLTIKGNAFLGGNATKPGGQATFNLAAGNVSITGTLKIYPTNNSAFNLSGGSLSLASLDLSNTPSLLHWTAGNLTIKNNTTLGPFSSDPTSNSLGTSLSLNANQSLTIIGDESLAAFALTLAAGASHTVTGNLTLSNSSLNFAPNSYLSYADFKMYDGTITGSFTNPSNFTILGGYISGTFINNGLASFNIDTGSPTSSPLSVVSNGQTFFNVPQHLNSLSIQTGPTYLAAGPTLTNNFSLAGSANAWTATLDLLQASLIINDLTPHTSSIATLQNQIDYAQSHTTGITADIDPAHAIIILDNAVAHLSTFQNIPVDANSIILTTALIGDFNLDGAVDINDLTIIANHWQQPVSDYSQGDFDHNQIVDILDLTAVANHWQATSATTLSIRPALDLPPSPSSPTPEPSTLALLFLSTAPLLKRKH